MLIIFDAELGPSQFVTNAFFLSKQRFAYEISSVFLNLRAQGAPLSEVVRIVHLVCGKRGVCGAADGGFSCALQRQRWRPSGSQTGVGEPIQLQALDPSIKTLSHLVGAPELTACVLIGLILQALDLCGAQVEHGREGRVTCRERKRVRFGRRNTPRPVES